jgi:hypothetical protein
MSKKYTTEIVDEKLKDKLLLRLESYVSVKHKIQLKCLKPKCNNIFSTTLDPIFSNNIGCPNCGGTKKLTNAIIDSRLQNRNIIRLDPYQTAKVKIRFQCTKSSCEYIFLATPDSVCNNGSGCSKCAKVLPYTIEFIDEELSKKQIRRLSTVDNINSNSNLELECCKETCKYKWKTIIGCVIRKRKHTGCPKCSKRARLTNDEVDLRLSNRNIKRLGDVINSSTKILFECIKCNYQWNNSPNEIFSYGCPKCAGSLPLTNEIVDQRLKDRTVKRVGQYLGIGVKIQFSCNTCNYLWMAKPRNVLNGTNCPSCAGSVPLTEEIADERLKKRFLLRLEPYISSGTLMQVKCLKETCGYVFSTNVIRNSGCPSCAGNKKYTEQYVDEILTNKNIKRLSSFNSCESNVDYMCLKESCLYKWTGPLYTLIQFKETGCQKCNKTAPLTDEIIDERLKGRNILRLDLFISSSTKMNWKCLKCEYIWQTNANKISMGTGCAKCSKVLKLTNEEVDLRLSGRNILRLDDYTSCNSMSFKCLICKNTWKRQTPKGVINGKSGCPHCNIGKNEKIVKEVLSNNNIIFDKQYNIKKISITARKLLLDFYIPHKNIAIEYNGAQHYSPVCFGGIPLENAKINFIDQQARDQYLQTFCYQNNIKLIWIDGREYFDDKLKKYLTDEIIPKLM